MSKKTSGLGRGLGDLLEDNAPEVRSSGTVIRRDEDGEVSISPEAVESSEIISSLASETETHAPAVSEKSASESIPDSIKLEGEPDAESEKVEKEELHHRTSLKAVFRSFK